MKLPKQAKLVHEGNIFDTYQWEQEMFDGSKTTFEMLRRTDTLQVIPTVEDRILVALEEQPMKGEFYSLLGGRRDPGEEPLEGVKRELLEESGMISTDWEEARRYEPYTKMDWTVYTFVARNCIKQAEQKLDAGEKITLKKVTFSEFEEVVFSKTFCGREFALDLMRMKYREPEDYAEFKKLIFPK